MKITKAQVEKVVAKTFDEKQAEAQEMIEAFMVALEEQQERAAMEEALYEVCKAVYSIDEDDDKDPYNTVIKGVCDLVYKKAGVAAKPVAKKAVVAAKPAEKAAPVPVKKAPVPVKVVKQEATKSKSKSGEKKPPNDYAKAVSLLSKVRKAVQEGDSTYDELVYTFEVQEKMGAPTQLNLETELDAEMIEAVQDNLPEGTTLEEGETLLAALEKLNGAPLTVVASLVMVCLNQRMKECACVWSTMNRACAMEYVGQYVDV